MSLDIINNAKESEDKDYIKNSIAFKIYWNNLSHDRSELKQTPFERSREKMRSQREAEL